MSVKVLKFGGSSVADPAQIRKIREIVEADPERRYVVVSAPGKRYSGDSKITDLLIMLKAVIDNNIPYEPLMAPIKERYMNIADELGIDVDLDAEFKEIRRNLDAEGYGNYIVSRGEYLSARLISAYLGYDFIDTKDLILFDNKGRLLIDQTNEALAAELAKHGIDATIVNPRFATGIDEQTLAGLCADHQVVVTLENGVIDGGFGEKIARFYGPRDMKVLVKGLKKEFYDKVPYNELMERNHLTPQQIAEDVMAVLK